MEDVVQDVVSGLRYRVYLDAKRNRIVVVGMFDEEFFAAVLESGPKESSWVVYGEDFSEEKEQQMARALQHVQAAALKRLATEIGDPSIGGWYQV